MDVEWTREARNDLKKIHDFYVKYFSIDLARKTIKEVFHKVKTLENSGYIGQKEELLKHLNQGHRYLIYNHNKIIYRNS